MFVLKFFKSFENSDYSENVCCERYEKRQASCGGYIFTVHFSGELPVTEFRVDKHHDKTHSFSHAFVENAAGKTIDRVNCD